MITLVAPGIWKLTLGTSEALTPSGLAATTPDHAHLAAFPAVHACPLPFKVDAASCRVGWTHNQTRQDASSTSPSISATPTARGFQVRPPLTSTA